MRTHKSALLVPEEYRDDKPERERKYRIVGAPDFKTRCATLDQIFNVVAKGHKHFVTLDNAPHIVDYDPELLEVVEAPIEIKPVRTRFYWNTEDLVGNHPGEKEKIEIRTEEKIGRHSWQQVVKLGRDGGKTLDRSEHKRSLVSFGINLDVYPEDVSKAAKKLLNNKVCKPLIRLEGQSKPLLYHPDGRTDMLLEIKFDKTSGKTVDGFSDKQAEVEIEMKEHPASMSKAEQDVFLNRAELFLIRDFSDYLQPIYESKVSKLFQHLVGRKLRDPQAFSETFNAHPGDRWVEWAPQ